MSASQPTISTVMSTETQNLRNSVQTSATCSGNYGSLAKSEIQPIFYVVHKVESNDTLQRLALKYSIHIQEIKRVNKLWYDAELGLFEHIYIPVNKLQLTAFQTKYPLVHVVYDLPKPNNRPSTLTVNKNISDKTTSLIQSSDTSTVLSKINNSPYKDYLSKVDQQIQSAKQTLQSIDTRQQYLNIESHQLSTLDISNNDCDTIPCKRDCTMTHNNEQQTSIHRPSDSVLTDLTTQNLRDKYISAALERIQQEKDDFDEL